MYILGIVHKEKIWYTTHEVNIMLSMRTLLLADLVNKYHHPDEIFSFCKACGHYNQNYSCPDHQMNPLEILSEYKFVTVYALKYVYSADTDLDLLYISTRKTLDRCINAFESDTKSLALIPGRCLLCDPCYKSIGKPCPTPEKIRYSLETLGFNLSELLVHEFELPLLWDNNEITFIFGFAHSTVCHVHMELISLEYLKCITTHRYLIKRKKS